LAGSVEKDSAGKKSGGKCPRGFSSEGGVKKKTVMCTQPGWVVTTLNKAILYICGEVDNHRKRNIIHALMLINRP
jgi:hypothetical protein